MFFLSKVLSASIQHANLYSKILSYNKGYLKFKFSIRYLFTWIFHVFFRNNWEAFHAQTNVFWLHYLADKLIRAKRYKRNTKKDQGLLREFRNFAKDMLEHTSACDLISSSDFFTSWPTVFIPQDQMFIIIYMYFMKIVFILLW